VSRQRYGKIQWTQVFVDRMKGRIAPLTPEAAGAYHRIFYAMLERQGPLPDDDGLLASVVQVSRPKWRRIRKELESHGIYEIRDGHVHDHVAQERIDYFIKRSRQNTENIGKRWNRGSRLEDAS